MTQRGLARLLDINQSSIAQWETGRTKPSRDVLPTLSATLGLPLDLLLDVSTGSPVALHPDAIQLAIRLSHLDDRTRTAMLAMADAWLAGGP